MATINSAAAMNLTWKTILLAGVLCVAACSRKVASSPDDLQAAFKKTDAESLKAATPEVQGLVDQTVAALQKDDQMTAVISLRSLRASGDITTEQTLAVENMMIKAQKVLYERAAKGDQQAIAALEALKMNVR